MVPYGAVAASTYIRSPLAAADTKIPYARVIGLGRGRTILLSGVSQRSYGTVHPPRIQQG